MSYPGAADPRRQRSNSYRAARYEDAPLSKLEEVRPQVVVFPYLLAALCLLISLAVVGSTFAGTVLGGGDCARMEAAVVGRGVACVVAGRPTRASPARSVLASSTSTTRPAEVRALIAAVVAST